MDVILAEMMMTFLVIERSAEIALNTKHTHFRIYSFRRIQNIAALV